MSAVFRNYYPYTCISLQMPVDSEKAQELDPESAGVVADEDPDPLMTRTELL
jgi:hypothetical protein